MAEVSLLAHLERDDALLEAETMRQVEREAQCRVLIAALHWARLNDVRHFDPATRTDGSERLVRIGGEGTPSVAEFAGAALAGRLGYRPSTATSLMADALDLAHRLPATWARVRAFEAVAGYARLAARKTRDLTPAQAAVVDAEVARSVDGRVGWTRFEQLLDAAIVRADVEAARAREEEAARRRFANATRSHAGMQSFVVHADIATIARLQATVTQLAQVLADLGDEREVDERRVTAVLLLADPVECVRVLRRHAERDNSDSDAHAGAHVGAHAGSDVSVPVVDEARLLPAVTLHVHLLGEAPSAATDSDADHACPDQGGVARVEGHGPVTTDWLRRTLGERARFIIRPVLDPLGQVPVAAYEVPDRHRHAVQVLTPGDVYPYATSVSRRHQLDHTQEWCPTCSRAAADGAASACACGGVSGVGNYGPMAPFHHRIKTHARGVDVQQPYPGIYLWRDATGRFHLVDATGTRTLQAPRVRHRRTNIELIWAGPGRDTAA